VHDDNGDNVLDINEFVSMQYSYWTENCKEILGIEDDESFAFAADTKELKPTFFLMAKSSESTLLFESTDNSGAQILVEAHKSAQEHYLTIKVGGEELVKYDINDPSH